MEKKLKILLLAKKFGETMPKHRHKYDMLAAIEEVADVHYWEKDGDIIDILAQLSFTPDLIFHYDIEWRHAFAPNIRNLHKVSIPKACYVLDVHYDKEIRHKYFHQTAKPDLILSASLYPFLRAFPECESRLHWLPFGINPEVITDYHLKKDVTYSLAGLLDDKYPFRRAVLRRMQKEPGFVHYKHPGHRTTYRPGLLVNETYIRALNRSQMSFTCGSTLEIPVAKFFEIPGCHTLMLAEPNPDIAELGFVDGRHYVACDGSNFYEKAMYYATHQVECAQITDQGYDFIQRHHTNAIRAATFIDIVKKELSL